MRRREFCDACVAAAVSPFFWAPVVIGISLSILGVGIR